MSNEITIDNKYLVLADGKENRKGEKKGVSSTVYKVEDMKTKEVYAAKVLKKEKYRYDFDNEIKMLNYLKEKGIKNIVNIIDSGDGDYKEGGNIPSKKKYIILEYEEKKDLTRYIDLMNKGFSELESDTHAQLLFLKILEAIKAIHKSGVCHRDIKTDNILLDNKFNPKICDFGFSTYIKNKKKKRCGTYPYVAPEVWITDKNAPQFAVSKIYISYFEKIITVYNEIYRSPKLESKAIIFFDDPEKRIKLNEIENCKWLKDYEEKSKDEKEKIEIGLYEEFLKREKKIKESTQKTIKCAKNYNEIGGSNKGMDVDGPFNEKNKITKFKFGKIFEFYIKIEGFLKYINFMNELYNEINKLYEQNEEYDCQIDCIDGKLKFKATFNIIKKEENEIINDEIAENNTEPKEKEENDEKNEGSEESLNYILERKECIINVELFNYDKGFLLRFLRKSGELEDFYYNLKILYSCAEDLL